MALVDRMQRDTLSQQFFKRRKEAKKQIAYFQKNCERMLYATFRAAGYFIGSGVVEAGCRTVVGQRLKQSGMFWSSNGDKTSSPSAPPS